MANYIVSSIVMTKLLWTSWHISRSCMVHLAHLSVRVIAGSIPAARCQKAHNHQQCSVRILSSPWPGGMPQSHDQTSLSCTHLSAAGGARRSVRHGNRSHAGEVWTQQGLQGPGQLPILPRLPLLRGGRAWKHWLHHRHGRCVWEGHYTGLRCVSDHFTRCRQVRHHGAPVV